MRHQFILLLTLVLCLSTISFQASTNYQTYHYATSLDAEKLIPTLVYQKEQADGMLVSFNWWLAFKDDKL